MVGSAKAWTRMRRGRGVETREKVQEKGGNGDKDEWKETRKYGLI